MLFDDINEVLQSANLIHFHKINFVGILGEWVVSMHGDVEHSFVLIDGTGPDHSPIFTVACKMKGTLTNVSIGKGTSRKRANRMAAYLMIMQLNRAKVNIKSNRGDINNFLSLNVYSYEDFNKYII